MIGGQKLMEPFGASFDYQTNPNMYGQITGQMSLAPGTQPRLYQPAQTNQYPVLVPTSVMTNNHHHQQHQQQQQHPSHVSPSGSSFSQQHLQQQQQNSYPHAPIFRAARQSESDSITEAIELVDRLAHFNQIRLSYQTTEGQPRAGVFHVRLVLGEEAYIGSGASLKQAHKDVALLALKNTKYMRPPQDVHLQNPNAGQLGQQQNGQRQAAVDQSRRVVMNQKKPKQVAPPPGVPQDTPITPTVHLNALAMKRREQVKYQHIESAVTVYNPTKMQYERQPNSKFQVILKVGEREFAGIGNTRQSARHDAAKKALEVLRDLPLPAADAAVAPIKSDISRVFEVAARHRLKAEFLLKSESGPAHMKQFVTSCVVGDHTTEGYGRCKKSSKLAAAQKMMEKLRDLPEPITISGGRRPNVFNRMAKNVEEPNFAVNLHPIQRLYHILELRRLERPDFGEELEITSVEELAKLEVTEDPSEVAYEVELTVMGETVKGQARTKKLAKARAAEAGLVKLGYEVHTFYPQRVRCPPIFRGYGPDTGPPLLAQVNDDDQTGDAVTRAEGQLDCGAVSAAYLATEAIPAAHVATMARQLLKGKKSELAADYYSKRNMPAVGELESAYSLLNTLVVLTDRQLSCSQYKLGADNVMCALELGEFVFCTEANSETVGRDSMAGSLLRALARESPLAETLQDLSIKTQSEETSS